MQKIMFEHRRFGLEQAVIARLKENTRRRVRFPKGINDEDVESAVMGIDEKGRVYFTFSTDTEAVDIYPKYQIGEKVAIAQSYATLLCELGVMLRRTDSGSVPVKVQDNVDFTKGDFIIDGTKIPKEYEAIAIQAIHNKTEIIDNKMFVRADLMPHVIEITDIKAERLQDISNEDCMKEGIIPVTWRQYPDPFSHHYVDHDLWTLEKYREHFEDAWSNYDPETWAATSPKAAFAVLIRKLQGKKAWKRNEWQFAYTFKLIK